MTNTAGTGAICVHDYPTYVDAHGYVRCDGCDRALGVNA